MHSMLFSFFMVLAGYNAKAQETQKKIKSDSITTKTAIEKGSGEKSAQSPSDTTKPKPVYHSPKKATIYSLVLPGLGQVYNHRWWKVPIIYTGFGVLYYFINFNNKYYKDFRDAYAWSLEQHLQPPVVPFQLGTQGFTSSLSPPNEYATKYNSAQLLQAREYYQRNLEMSYMLTGALWLIQVADAAVDAHFFNFSLSNDLSLNVKPWVPIPVQKQPGIGGGLSLSMKF